MRFNPRPRARGDTMDPLRYMVDCFREVKWIFYNLKKEIPFIGIKARNASVASGSCVLKKSGTKTIT